MVESAILSFQTFFNNTKNKEGMNLILIGTHAKTRTSHARMELHGLVEH